MSLWGGISYNRYTLLNLFYYERPARFYDSTAVTGGGQDENAVTHVFFENHIVTRIFTAIVLHYT